MSERRKSIDSYTDSEKMSYRGETTEDSQSSVSPISSISSQSDSVRDGPEEGRKTLDGSSPGGRVQIRKEILRLVERLDMSRFVYKTVNCGPICGLVFVSILYVETACCAQLCYLQKEKGASHFLFG